MVSRALSRYRRRLVLPLTRRDALEMCHVAFDAEGPQWVECCHVSVWKRMSASALQLPKADGQLSAHPGRLEAVDGRSNLGRV